MAEGPGFTGRQVTEWSGDDGQDLAAPVFTPDGRAVVFVRGGGPNRQGEFPNPSSEPEPAERAIWIAPLDGGEPRRIAEGSSPLPAPDGETLFYLSRGQVYSVPYEGMDGEDGETRPPPRPLFAIRGSADDLVFSPDGDRLAFSSRRGDHAFIGVFVLDTREIRWLDPSLDRDASPVFSADGRRIAYLRIPNEAARLPFAPVRTALPWSIRTVDLESGEAEEVWRASGGPGSAFESASGPALVWTPHGHLIFPWERDGWLHLYAVPDSGGTARLLTPGAFEVEHVAASPDRRSVVFSSNQDDIDRRHLWRVAPGDPAPTRLTGGDGIEWGPAVSASGAAVAFLASDATTPAHAEVLAPGGGRRPLVSGFMPASFPQTALVTPRQVVFEASDGIEIHGQLFLPPGADDGERRPAAVFFHGGSRRQMLLGWHYLRYYHNAYALNQYLASRGYVVLSVNYRSGTGYGLEFREALDYGARGASEYRDVLAAARWLRARDDVDPDRIALWGGSYGGYLTALGLARNSELFAAGVDLHGVHDWNVVIRNFVPSYAPGDREEVARLALESSPMAAIDGWRSPVLLIHGDDDRNVPFSESVTLIEELRKRGVHVEQLVFPDEVHGFLLHRNWLAAFRAAADFLDRHLGPAPAAAGEGS